MNKTIKDLLKMVAFSSAVTCNWLLFAMLVNELVTGRQTIVYFNNYHEIWVEFVFMSVGFWGLLIFIKDWLREQWEK